MFRFVNEMTLLNHFEPMELQLYQTLVMKDIETTKAVLQKKWFPEVQNIFYRGNKRKQIPFTRLDPFFESVAVLMTNLLRELTLDSITEYREVFSPLPNKDKVGIFPGFVLSAVVNGTSVEFEPSPHGFEIVIINVFDKMIEASCSLPRVESKLYPSESAYSAQPNLHPYIDENMIQETKDEVYYITTYYHYNCRHGIDTHLMNRSYVTFFKLRISIFVGQASYNYWYGKTNGIC
jgi:dynein heavy chain